jgi:hypothetical protein
MQKLSYEPQTEFSTYMSNKLIPFFLSHVRLCFRVRVRMVWKGLALHK